MSARQPRHRALVGNAADPAQVKRAAQVTRDRVDRVQAQYRAVLATDAGRAVLWDVLTHCGVFASCFASDVSLMAARAGQQDVGHWLIAQIDQADPTALGGLMAEAHARTRREQLEAEAARPPAPLEESPDVSTTI